MSGYRAVCWVLPLVLVALAAGGWYVQECSCAGETGAAGAAGRSETVWTAPWGRGAREPVLTPPDPRWLEAYPVAKPRTYRGRNLEHVLMPIGGIGTGTIWLDGQGRLAVWQIFNNHEENRIPDSFFAIRAQAEGKPAVVRLLQTVPEEGFQPMPALEYEGGYPIARLYFDDPTLPVKVRLEAFNPLIPTDTANSALPCAFFRITARNEGATPVRVHALGTLQNAVGSSGGPGIHGVRSARYGGNRNQFLRQRGRTALLMHQGLGHLVPGLQQVRNDTGARAEGPDLLWVDRLGGPVETAAAGPQATEQVELMARLTREGGVIVAAGVTPQFFEAVKAVQQKVSRWQDTLEVFEDFEKDSYEGWSVRGTAFGDRPHTGTSPGQQPVSGFFGRGLVNTYRPDDGPQGELVSRPFTIRKRYIGFLIGGGEYAGETCINLRVAGQVVRTATGKNAELLEATSWEVSDLIGKEAVLEIVDHHSGGWGHINVDHIVFADVPPDSLMRLESTVEALAAAIPLSFTGAAPGGAAAIGIAQVTDPAVLHDLESQWSVRAYTRLTGFRPGAAGYRVLASLPNGDPLILMGPAGKATLVLCLAPDLPREWAERLLLAARGRALEKGQRLVAGAPQFGSMALASPNRFVTARNWTESAALAEEFARSGALGGNGDSAETPPGQTVNGALSVPMTVPPGEERTATFVITWHFPNAERHGHPGNLYNRRFRDALAVADYACANAQPLWERTRLYHATLYQSNLPEEFLDAISSQSVVFRGPTAWWAEDGYFAGYEGCYGCCPLNCTHVWNYAQTHARLFPEVGRNMRESDLLVFLHESGETSHRQHAPHNAFIDGHAATIEAAYREYQLSPDRQFLERVWPAVKKAVDWLIQAIDKDGDGVPSGHQWNTYDCAVSGANTFIGSQYLSALAAGERMAQVMGEEETAARWRALREAGMKNQNERLWNGEYYIQIPDPQPAHDYNTGCHSDQLLGQWWAHQLGLGYLYPRERVRQALEAILRHNFREQFAGFQQAPRRYVLDDEGGLLMCTWPKGGRPDPFIIYADEVWTGIEYATAGQMIYEGMIEEARQIVRTARGRYDGRRRDGLNSGPGGNPFNELECGKFYARAMSSWGLLIASQGLILEGPAGRIGFQPNWQPENHRSFVTAPEGWGLFLQQRNEERQLDRIEVRHGRLKVQELVFAVPEGTETVRPTVTIAGRAAKVTAARAGTEVRLRLAAPVTVTEGQTIEVTLAL